MRTWGTLRVIVIWERMEILLFDGNGAMEQGVLGGSGIEERSLRCAALRSG